MAPCPAPPDTAKRFEKVSRGSRSCRGTRRGRHPRNRHPNDPCKPRSEDCRPRTIRPQGLHKAPTPNCRSPRKTTSPPATVQNTPNHDGKPVQKASSICEQKNL